MNSSISYLPYKTTGYFSKLATDYLEQQPALADLYTFAPDAAGLKAAIEARSQYPVDRKVLVDTLQKQYEGYVLHDSVNSNLEKLRSDNTFTVCTAHQPNLLTGYLYFIYKIIHAVKLAEQLGNQYPDKAFVPVYYMGSEDNDLEELGTFRYNNKKYVWDAAGQTGAVGRMDTKSLKPLLEELFKVLGPPGATQEALQKLLTTAYLKHKTIGEATRYLVNELFGKYGLIVLDADEAVFKQAIAPIIKDELLQGNAYGIVTTQIEKLEANYKAQAHPRPLNLFYLKDDIRERIERKGDAWQVVHTDISWNEQELLTELEAHPERFSPNVILRGMLQESILPDVGFIGGGAEVAYWLQLKSLFDHYKVFYPVVLLRQSALWMDAGQSKQLKQMQLSLADIFKPETELVREYINQHCGTEWQTTAETAAIEKIMADVKQKAVSLDTTLRGSADAVLTKMKYQLQVLEKKMLRAEKRKMQTQLQRISKAKESIFPKGSLQERTDNFLQYYLQHGDAFTDILKDAMEPMKQEFLIIEETT